MGDMKKRQGQTGWNWLLKNVYDCTEFLTVCWTFLMLTVFPLYVIDGYHDIGAYKFSFFSGVSALFLVPGAVLAILWHAGMLVGSTGKGGSDKEGRPPAAGRSGFPCLRGLSALDICVALYTAACLISYLQSDYREDAWAGVDGWNMGLHTQLSMAAAYYLISRFFPWNKKELPERWRGADGGRKAQDRSNLPKPGPGAEKSSFGVTTVIAGALIGSGLTFLLGIFHRFGIDPLGMYVGIDSSYQIRFLSTIGQATWYSGYVCTVFPIGLCLFYISREKKVRIWSGLYCVLAFMTLVTQNSDSAFAALGLLYLGIFAASCRRRQGMGRFLECVILCAASFKAVGLLQWGFAGRAMELGRLSTAFSKGSISWILLLAASAAYLALLKGEAAPGREDNWERTGRRLQKAAFAAAAGGLTLTVTAITLNTTGLLKRWFGISSQNQYLLFDDRWGSDRGFIWKTALEIFNQMPFAKKIFGAGPDCFMAYSYGIPAYAQKLNDYWKPDILTNAHNEFLNLLICVGAAGLAAWIGLLAAAALRFYRKGEERPFALMGLFAVCAYSAHNFFCYQQVCATPFLFAILGLAEGLVRRMEPAEVWRPVVFLSGRKRPLS